MRAKKRVLKYSPNLAPGNTTSFHAAHLASDTWLGICCPHLAAHESCYRGMCLSCRLLVKPRLSPQDLPTSKQPSLCYFPSPVLIFSQEIIGHKKLNEWLGRTGWSKQVSLGCLKPCLACITATFANISVCGPWNFSSMHNLHFFDNKLLSFNFPRVQEVLRYSPFLSSSTHDPQTFNRKPQHSTDYKNLPSCSAAVVMQLKLDLNF